MTVLAASVYLEASQGDRWDELRLKLDRMWSLYLLERAGAPLDANQLPSHMLQEIYGYKDVDKLYRQLAEAWSEADPSELRLFLDTASAIINGCFKDLTSFQKHWIKLGNMNPWPDLPKTVSAHLQTLKCSDQMDEFLQLLSFLKWFQVGESYSANREYLQQVDFDIFEALDLDELMGLSLRMVAKHAA